MEMYASVLVEGVSQSLHLILFVSTANTINSPT